MKVKTRIIAVMLATMLCAAGLAGGCKRKPSDTDPDNPPIVKPEPEPEKPEDKSEIVIKGADDLTISQGTFFDCYAGVTAVTQKGTDVTAQLSVSGDLNTSKAGSYTLTYSVKNSGNTVEKQRKITVVANPAIGVVKPTPVYTVEGGGDYNIAKGCEVTCNSSSNNAAYAVDGDFSTRWESVHGVDNVNYTVNLGARLAFNQINIYWEDAYATDFELLISDDGKSWVSIEKVEGQSLPSETVGGSKVRVNRFDYTDAAAQYVRLAATKRATAYGYSVFEFEILGPTGTVIPADLYPDLYSAEKDGSPDWKQADSEWVEYDLGGVKSVNTLRLAFKSYLTPAAYRVLYAGADREFKELTIKNLPYSGDTFAFYADRESNAQLTVSARYFRVEMTERRFYVPSYRITEAEFRLRVQDGEGQNSETKIPVVSATASSSLAGHGIELSYDGKDDTYWENDNDNEYQTIDLGEVKSVGCVDLYWRGDDGGKGKYYDLLISDDGESWTTVFRQTHGATSKQSVYVYENARYIRVVDYQNPASDRFNLEGIVVRSQYPESSGEGKVEYDVSLAFPEWQVINYGNGSYATGGTDFPSSRLIAYLDDSLRGKPVPSNDWWQGLLIADKGYNMYMNPLTATFKTDGLWLTNPGEGYFDGFVPGNGSQTVNVDVSDICIGYAGMGKDAEVRVKSYSDYGISAVMSDDRAVDKLTAFLSEGSLYSYFLFAEPEKALIKADAVTGVYDLAGNEILDAAGADYTGDGIVVKVRTHSTYEGGVRKYKDANGNVYEYKRVYEDRYYVISVPANTKFIRNEDDISVVMTAGNYMSVGAASHKDTVKDGAVVSTAVFPAEEVKLLHEHGYAFVTDTSCTYEFDEATNAVTTTFRLRTVLMRGGYSAEAYSAYLPHQLSKSDYKGGYVYESVRGDCRSHEGNVFVTKDTFYGLVPTFVEPTDPEYSSKVLYDQLVMVYNNNGGDKAPEDSNLISGDPYWQGKNLHPMAMAALAADQIGATDLRDKFLDKIEYILTDWFTYDPVKDAGTGAYFYYDGEWGTLYYKNSEFGAGVNLADHYFTYGYYTLAAGVLTAYRQEFADEWGNMIELLIRDYMNPSREDEMFPYMRNFDPFAGHGWAGGYADNNGGNNQESAGEALNSWVGAYLYATAVGNEEVRTAAIYGYTTELNAIKHYWFNYFDDFPESYPYGVVGQVYGGSNFFGTFFNGQPLYMYGIHLIPGEEYLTSYGINQEERVKLEGMIDKMREEQRGWDVEEKDKEINAWQHIFIPIVAIYDADEAIEWYKEVLAKQGNVGNTSEQFNVYYLIHGMKSTGVRTTDIWAENGASATVYEKDGGYTALCWNPTDKAVKYTFRNKDGVVGYAVVPAGGLVSCDPTENTERFESYKDYSEFEPASFSEGTNAAVEGGSLSLGANGSVSYLLSFGSADNYFSIKINGANDSVKLFIDGGEVELTAVDGGYESKPVTLSFKHTITVTGSNVRLSGIDFNVLQLVKSDVGMTAVASTENGDNTADKAVDGDTENTRWESVHGQDGEWLQLELSELTEIYQLRIYWEAASAKEYKVYFSQTGEDGDWTEVFNGDYSQGRRTDLVNPNKIMQVKYIRIEGVSRTTNYGYSIYEVEIYNFNKN